MQPLTEMLTSCSREDLIALIQKMVKRHPDLMSLVEITTSQLPNQPIDMSGYRHQAAKALSRHDVEDVTEDLQELYGIGNQFLRDGDWLNAGALYQMLLEETIDSYDEELQQVDYDGEIAGLSQECAEGLGNCLAEAEQLDITVRELWLTTLLAGVLKDLELGGIDFAAGACEPMLEYATEAEWEWIEARIRNEISASDRWKRESLVHILTERRNLTGRTQEGNTLIHELGTPEQRAFLLVEEGKIEEAIALAQQHLQDAPGTMVRFADRLIEAEAHEKAEQLITALYEKKSDWSYRNWLAKYHLKFSDSQTALDWQEDVFSVSPSLERYETICGVAQKLGIWEELRFSLLNNLETKNQLGLLIEIALHEQDIERALELAANIKGYNDIRYKEKVAEAAKKTHPQEVIALYQQLAHKSISEKNRKAYQVAAQYLQQAKAVYESQNADSDWETYIKGLRSQYPNLPALQDELRKAKL